MEYVGTARAAELLGVAKSTVSRWCREGKFPGAQQDGPGKPWRIPLSEVEKLIRKRRK